MTGWFDAAVAGDVQRLAVDLGASKVALRCGTTAIERDETHILPEWGDGERELAWLVDRVLSATEAAYRSGDGGRPGRDRQVVLASAPELDRSGSVRSWGRRPHWLGLPILSELERAVGTRPVAIDDGLAAAIAESARRSGDFCLLILGTGLGGAVVRRGAARRLPRPVREVGHVQLPDAIPVAAGACPCGGRACAQLVLSAPALLGSTTGRGASVAAGGARSGAVADAAQALAHVARRCTEATGCGQVVVSGRVLGSVPELLPRAQSFCERSLGVEFSAARATGLHPPLDGAWLVAGNPPPGRPATPLTTYELTPQLKEIHR